MAAGTRRKRESKEWLALLLIGAGCAVAATVGPNLFGFVERTENYVADRMQGTLGRSEPLDERIVVVTITEDTLAAFPYRSPVNRDFLADLVEALEAREVAGIAIDILFDQRTLSGVDERLRSVLTGASVPIVVATGDSKAGLTDAQLAFQRDYLDGILTGYAELSQAGDGKVRDLPLRFVVDGTEVDGLALALARSLGFEPSEEPRRLAYRQGPGPDAAAFAAYDAAWVVRRNDDGSWVLPADWFAGRAVFIGADQPQSDRHGTPFGADFQSHTREMPGVLIHAHAFAQMIDGRRLPLASTFLRAVVCTLAVLFGMILVHWRINIAGRLALVVIGGPTLVTGVAILVFYYGGLLLPVVAPSAGLLLGSFLKEAYERGRQWKQRQTIRRAFTAFVPPEIVQELEEDPDRLAVHGEKREMTFIFTDVAGFTTLSESTRPRFLVPLLNSYLDGMSQIVLKHGGTIDKFVGDAVVAFFGAPKPMENHQQRALACALEMDEFAERFREEQRQKGITFGHTRIGLHAGEATVGNFGGEKRFDYTAIGDVVNTAARLEGMNKYFGTRILVSSAVADCASGYVFRPVGDVVAMGKETGITVCEPLSGERAGDPSVERYARAFALLIDNDVTAAKAAFTELHHIYGQDGLIAFHHRRLQKGEGGARVVMEGK
ncbi:adenylate/guanylate cyclase domain-containing protein [Oceanibacterium hippocampi]|uniref:Adenylate cyclase 1 n=1 Tax=Oceanibacterium hippocampi TaxID=745714 RepID=A0A1Y5U526_9PROT|nr:adenylate/guanylate cyclase domain-containing protein [Oceanibacterium hippocampi]SLN77160.1 Adenylate cyclase 1 [Oceanibacterium hippocampi]